MTEMEKAAAAAETLMRKIDAAGGPALETALRAAWLDLLGYLIFGVVAALAAVALAFLGRRWWRKPRSFDEEWGLAAIACWVTSALATIMAVSVLLNPFLWAGLSRPELWLAAKVLGL